MDTYEKKYKEALAHAREIHRNEVEKRIDMEFIFPELAESEDEKIKKWLICGMNALKEQKAETFATIPIDDILAWLEKQGEQKPTIEMITPEESLGIDSETYNKIVGECIYGEQNPDDKVEPKFKVGDWITNGDYTWKIVEVEPLDYILQSQDGNIVDDTISHVDEQFHSFTIEDAKDGDVLIDKSGSRECPFIFKEIKPSDIKTDMLNPLTVLGYCGIGGAGFTKGSGWGDTANCKYYPATKEQRDFLFQKITEAGYKWDANKLELEKINMQELVKQNSTWNEEDEEMLKSVIATCELVEQERDSSPAKHLLEMQLNWLKAIKSRVQSKQEWSEEDEDILGDIIEDVMTLHRGKTIGVIRNKINWLKSIKPQPKQEWSEEDEENIEKILDAIGSYYYLTTDDDVLCNWLKSIKQRMEEQ